jgi:hypothetical protein
LIFLTAVRFPQYAPHPELLRKYNRFISTLLELFLTVAEMKMSQTTVLQAHDKITQSAAKANGAQPGLRAVFSKCPLCLSSSLHRSFTRP